MDVNPYESPKVATDQTQKSLRYIPMYVAICASTIMATSLLFTVACGFAIGHLQSALSSENLRFSLSRGAFWGVLGAVIASLSFANSQKLPFAVAFACAWSIVSSVLFYLYISVFMLG